MREGRVENILEINKGKEGKLGNMEEVNIQDLEKTICFLLQKKLVFSKTKHLKYCL